MKEKLLLALHSLKNINIPSLGFITVTSHIVIQGAGIGDALALMSISALYGYKSFLNKNQNDSLKVMEKEIGSLKSDISSLKVKTLQSPSPDKQQAKRFF